MDGIKHYTHDNKVLIKEVAVSNENTISILGDSINDEYLKKGYYEVDDSTGESLNVNLSEKGLAVEGLKRTDWKITRHRDELELGKETTLSKEEYEKLLIKRQNWRDKV
jgi:hypothetical protein